jgi:hypothetical protein
MEASAAGREDRHIRIELLENAARCIVTPGSHLDTALQRFIAPRCRHSPPILDESTGEEPEEMPLHVTHYRRSRCDLHLAKAQTDLSVTPRPLELSSHEFGIGRSALRGQSFHEPEQRPSAAAILP